MKQGAEPGGAGAEGQCGPGTARRGQAQRILHSKPQDCMFFSGSRELRKVFREGQGVLEIERGWGQFGGVLVFFF